MLAVEGAPLVFSTNLAHDLVVHVWSKSGQSIDLPAKADATRGGLVVDTHAVKSEGLGPLVSATVRGQWGFDSFDGPTFQLQTAHPAKWTVASAATILCICIPRLRRACRTSQSRTARARS